MTEDKLEDAWRAEAVDAAFECYDIDGHISVDDAVTVTRFMYPMAYVEPQEPLAGPLDSPGFLMG